MRVNWYPELAAGSPPIGSERPVAGENQTGCDPVAGSRRLAAQGRVGPPIPSGSTGSPGTAKPTGAGAGLVAAVGRAAAGGCG